MSHELTNLFSVERLQKEKADILRTLEAHSEASTKKIDTKTQKALDYCMKVIPEVNKRFELEKAELEDKIKGLEAKIELLKDKNANANKYYDSEIKRLQETTDVPKPERIIRAEMRLSEIESNLKLAVLNDESFKTVNSPGYVKPSWMKLPEPIPWAEIEMPSEKELEEKIAKVRSEEAGLPPRKMKVPKLFRGGGEKTTPPMQNSETNSENLEQSLN